MPRFLWVAALQPNSPTCDFVKVDAFLMFVSEGLPGLPENCVDTTASAQEVTDAL